jgi:hypothetical protein
MDVPLFVEIAEFDETSAETIADPGANISRQVP